MFNYRNVRGGGHIYRILEKEKNHFWDQVMLQRPALTTQVLEKLPWLVLAGGEVLRMSLSTEVCWLSHLMLLLLRNTRAADVSSHNLISVNLEAFDCTDASEAIRT